ncbi:MAG: radical SAM protein [Oscillospiraceae bacterium]|nr:radical SAM protein [Oscillospiraceae bacterium]
MQENFDPIRYAVIAEKNKREIVLLRGMGCVWRRCRFCDYHLDRGGNPTENYRMNRAVLGQVTGAYGTLEVINSGSFPELDDDTMETIEHLCAARRIHTLHVECHWLHRAQLPALRARFGAIGVTVQVKTGVETFDALFRESYLDKGIETDDPAEIARWFDECCLLQGLPGQTANSMQADIETGLAHFKRVCVNLMQENSTPIHPDPTVTATFIREVYPLYRDHPRVDILLSNTDFGVGGEKGHAE